MKSRNVEPVRSRSFLGEMTVNRFESKIRPLINQIQLLRREKRFSKEFKSWSKDVESLLCFSFGDESAQAKGFLDISYSPLLLSTSTPDSFLDECFYSGLDCAEVYLNNVLKEVLEYFPRRYTALSTDSNCGVAKMSKDVFIVHGHDESMLYKVKDFLNRLDLNPIVLRDQPNEGKTIIEKFETAASTVGFAIVLLTADDVGRAKGEEYLKNRARQNVVFELGYFTGKFGRSRIAALCDKSVETPGDIAGVVYTLIDEEGAWMLGIARDMRKAGLEIDLNKIV